MTFAACRGFRIQVFIIQYRLLVTGPANPDIVIYGINLLFFFLSGAQEFIFMIFIQHFHWLMASFTMLWAVA